jgi:VWFA-related protein
MRRAGILASLLIIAGLSSYLVAQELQKSTLQHLVQVINVGVPVRVFLGDSFVDDLTLHDFEVYENGAIQELEAVYLIKKTSIERREESTSFRPETSRSFYLLFLLYEYNPKIREAIRYFFNNVAGPEDRVVIITPVTSYQVKKRAITAGPEDRLVEKVNNIIRKDILTGTAVYRAALGDLKRMSRSKEKAIEDQGIDVDELADLGVSSDEEFLAKYRTDLQRFQGLGTIDEAKFFEFAQYLKNTRGRKCVYLFYQREFTPLLDRNIQSLYETNIVTQQMQQDLFGFYNRVATIAVNRLNEVCADSAISIHFLYLTTIPVDIARGQMEERSWDIYEAFSEMAKATGGLAMSSSDATFLMEQASRASENYYLLYYSPKDKVADGKFRRIEVKVKRGRYRITHLAGYSAK